MCKRGLSQPERLHPQTFVQTRAVAEEGGQGSLKEKAERQAVVPGRNTNKGIASEQIEDTGVLKSYIKSITACSVQEIANNYLSLHHCTTTLLQHDLHHQVKFLIILARSHVYR